MSRRKTLGLMLAGMVLALLLVPTGAGAAPTRTYSITVHNMTDGQPFTPPVAVTHRQSIKVFKVGREAKTGVQEIAENGNLDPLLADLTGKFRVADLIAAGAPEPILPGGSLTFDITSTVAAKRFSIISMLVCTNDGFTGLDAVRLPTQVGVTDEYFTNAYDAGTEANTENLADIVPPCSGFATGTGMSNPNLATNGVIAHHPGIQGTGSCDMILDPGTHGWTDVAKVEITRTS